METLDKMESVPTDPKGDRPLVSDWLLGCEVQFGWMHLYVSADGLLFIAL